MLLILAGVIAAACTKKGKEVPDDMVKEAELTTSLGKITFEFRKDLAPGHVENFIKLAKSGFYDGTTFHRVIPGFMIQGGDPNSKSPDKSRHGFGGPGYQIKAEFSQEKHVRGTVSMARGSDPNSAGSQFFIMVQDSTHLDGQYSVFGKVTSGLEVVDKIVSVQRDGNDNPLERVELKKATLR